MAGGTWTTQYKVLPGVYIRFKSAAALGLTVGERGIVTICEPMSWGPVAQVTEITPDMDLTPITGYDITAPENLFIRQIFLGTDRTNPPTKLLLYRPTASGSAQATATIGELTATALYPGARGNDITIIVTALTEPESSFQVSTVVDGNVVDQQIGANVDDLVANDWVTWSGSGALSASTGQALTSGQDGTVQSAAYSAYLTAIEPYKFDVMIYDGEDSSVLTALQSFIQRVNEENGQYCQLVAAEVTNPNTQYIINVNSPATLSDGTQLTPQQVTWWAGGASAGALYNQSLTYAQYPGAVATTMQTNAQFIQQVQAGEFVLFAEDGVVKVMQDINSLTTFAGGKTSDFTSNRLIRVLDGWANDVARIFGASYLGLATNNDTGRQLFKADLVSLGNQYQDIGAISDFESADIEIDQGAGKRDVAVASALKPNDSMEKLYMTVHVA